MVAPPCWFESIITAPRGHHSKLSPPWRHHGGIIGIPWSALCRQYGGTMVVPCGRHGGSGTPWCHHGDTIATPWCVESNMEGLCLRHDAAMVL